MTGKTFCVDFHVILCLIAYPTRVQKVDDDEDDRPLVGPDHTAVSEEEDEDDKPLVQPVPALKPESSAIRRVPTPLRRRKGPPVWRDPTATLEQDVSGNSRERSEDVSSLGRKPDGEALQKIINKLSDVRNMKDLHLKHYHMSSAQLNKRTTHLDMPGKVYDLNQHVIKTCPLCNSTKPRPDRSSQKNLEISSYWIMYGSTKIGDETFGFLIVLDGAASHLTACPCKSTFPSEVISKLHGRMEKFQMNPKAICADMTCRHLHDMQAFCRMHSIKRFPTRPHTPWPNRAEMGVRLFNKFLTALVDAASKNSDKTTLS